MTSLQFPRAAGDLFGRVDRMVPGPLQLQPDRTGGQDEDERGEAAGEQPQPAVRDGPCHRWDDREAVMGGR